MVKSHTNIMQELSICEEIYHKLHWCSNLIGDKPYLSNIMFRKSDNDYTIKKKLPVFFINSHIYS